MPRTWASRRSNSERSSSYEGIWTVQTGVNAAGKNASTTFFLPRYSDSRTFFRGPPLPAVSPVAGSSKSGASSPTSTRHTGFFFAAMPPPRCARAAGTLTTPLLWVEFGWGAARKGRCRSAPRLLSVRHGSADEIRRQRSSPALEEEALAEGAGRQGRDLRLLRVDARARPALAAARDHREDGEGARRSARQPPRQVGRREITPRASGRRAATPPGSAGPPGAPRSRAASPRSSVRPRGRRTRRGARSRADPRRTSPARRRPRARGALPTRARSPARDPRRAARRSDRAPRRSSAGASRDRRPTPRRRRRRGRGARARASRAR